MLGHFGFSYVGLIFMIMLMVPNIIWAKNQPQGYTAENENKVLAVFERIGEVLATCCALVFSDFNLRAWSLWSLWCGVPLAGATLPVLAFFLLGIYGKVIWMLIACVILGIGHIGIHWQHSKEL